MNLHKKLVKFYKKSKALDVARLKSKDLKNTDKKLIKTKTYELIEIQDAINHYMEIKKCADRIEKLVQELFEIRRTVIQMLNTIGLPSNKVILIEDEHFGTISLWHQNTELFFKEKN